MAQNRATNTSDAAFSQYESRAPSSQNAVDLLDGWNSSFPDYYNVVAGKSPLHYDERIFWGINQAGGIDGKKLLELGPLEGCHTYICEQHNVGSITAIEANKDAYLRCLISKEIFGLKRASFLLGDFVKYLEETEEHYDIVIAAGVLYHMKDPVYLLEQIVAKTNAVFLWTHYFDDEAMPRGDSRRVPFSESSTVVDRHGLSLTLHERHYYQADQNDDFCGGAENRHYWMEKDDIVQLMSQFGFTDVRMTLDEKNHINGPCCMFYFAKV